MIHRRFVCPVGQGGFHIETIGDMTIVFDCGSATSLAIVEDCIDILRKERDRVDYLFISHLDTDHVNSLGYLLHSVKVCKAVTPMIPQELKEVYSIATNGAYNTIIAMLQASDVTIEEVGNDDNWGRDYSFRDIWEWIAKSMMQPNDFSLLTTELTNEGIDCQELGNAQYLEEEKASINNAFKTVFGSQGPNAKGLIMLSQRSENVKVRTSKVYKGCRCCYSDCDYPMCIGTSENSSCLYVGDANLKKKANLTDVQAFLRRMTDNQLELMQIPHHGSQYNSGKTLNQDIVADYYFLNDTDTRRLQKNDCLFNSLMRSGKLLVARENPRNMISTATRIFI